MTDVGAGAGSQSRATDTHLVLRPHEEDGAIVLDAAVRSWPPIDPFCLRWNFPVWSPGLDLDSTCLRNESRRRRAKASNDQPTEPDWAAQRFADAFVGDEPKPTVVITAEAKKAGLSERKAKELLKQAEATGLAHRWRFAPNKPIAYASQLQPGPTDQTKP